MFKINFYDAISYFINIILIVIIILLVYYITKQKYKNKILELSNKYLEENLIQFKYSIDKYRELKHNIINDFLFFKTITDIDKQELIDEKIEKYYEDYNMKSEINNIPQGFQGLLYLKSIKAKKKDVEFSLKFDLEFDYKEMKPKLFTQLSDALSIVLDNAIDASYQIQDGFVFVSAYSNEIENEIVFEIINRFNNKIDLNRIGDENYSTKECSRGLGLSYIDKLSDDIKTKKEIIDNLFKMTICVKVKRAS